MSLNRDDVIRNYKQLCKVLDLETKCVVLSGGAALVMLGLRKHTDDLDADIPLADYNKALQRKPEQQGLTGPFVAFDGITDLCCSRDPVWLMEIMYVDGVYIYSPKRLIAQKEIMCEHPDRSPEKKVQDHKDLKLLKVLHERLTKLHEDV